MSVTVSLPIGLRARPLRNLGARNEVFIALVFALEFEKVVVPAGLSIRVFAADLRPCLVDRAAALILIEKLADGRVDRIFPVLKDVLDFPFFVTILDGVLGDEFFPSSCLGDPEMSGQPTNIFFRHGDPGVATAIPGTFTTVVLHLGHGTIPH